MPSHLPIQDVLSRAEHERQSGCEGRARRACQILLILVPSHAAVLFQRAAMAFGNDAIQPAFEGFQRVGCVLPAASPVHYNLGVCARRLNDHEFAERHLRRALVLEPAAAGAMDSLAQSLTVLKSDHEAIRMARRLCWLRPRTADAWATLGYVAWRGNRGRSGLKALRRSLILAPGARGPEANFASTLVSLDQHDQAIRRYRRLLRLDPLDPSIWGNLGVALMDVGDWHGAAAAYRRYARLARGRPINHIANDPLPDFPVEPILPLSRATAWHRLGFERDQLSYLLRRGVLPARYAAEVSAYTDILAGLGDQEKAAISFDLSEQSHGTIARVHGRLLHLHETGWNRGGALNQDLDWGRAQNIYYRSDPRVSVIDGFLNADALLALRQFCLESTIWFQLKGAGYLGAYFREGFNDPLLLAIADELAMKMPTIFADQPLRMMWAFNYEQSMVGINPHADFAGVNVNFWITPDTANLEPETGGLLVYRRPAPKEWSFEQYNAAPGSEIMRHLGEDAKHPLRIAHRQNRAVVFDSRLFHETDRLRFRPGFENRRINVTMLFGGQ